MKYALLLAALVFSLTAGAAFSQSISLTGPDRAGMLEGNTYRITWSARNIKSVSLVAHGARTPLGNRSRGNFDEVIAQGIPAERGEATWTVPWIDAVEFFVKAKGYDAGGRVVAIDERGYSFRPRVLANRTADGLYLDLSHRYHQRLYVQKDYKITRAYLSSSSMNYHWMPPGHHISTPHDHAGVFSVLEKTPNHHSVLFDVDMRWAMRYHGGHFIHATSPNLYEDLGHPASHGCNRLTWVDAREVYRLTPLGTRVEVIGPEG